MKRKVCIGPHTTTVHEVQSSNDTTTVHEVQSSDGTTTVHEV